MTRPHVRHASYHWFSACPKTALIMVGLLLAAPGAGAGQRVAEVVDSLMRAEMAARPIAGMQLAVIQGSDTLFWRGLGSADLEHGVPLGPEGVFQIASVTKQFTAAAVLTLVEAGRLGLDDDVRRYLPELETGGQVVRIRHLLNHTAGIPNVYEMTSWPRIRPLRLDRPQARALEMAGVAEDSLDFPPGTSFHYSNTGYDLLGDVIEEVTGESVETYFRRRLFAPLGLDHTSLCPWTRVIPNRVWGYEPDSAGTALENAWRQDQAILHTSGGLCSTAGDLLRWNDALHHGRVVRGVQYHAMTTPEGAARSYGYGLFVRDLAGHPKLEHNGYTPGFSTQLDYYPRDRLTVVVLANSPAAVGTLASDVARVVLGLPARTIPVRPPGWRLHAVDADADTTATHFRVMGAGVHVTSGPGAVYFHPDSVARGAFTLSATLVGMADPGPELGHGLVFGGRSLDQADASYVAFVTRRSGEFALVRHSGKNDEHGKMISPWTPNPAVQTVGMASNGLRVDVSETGVVLSINGTEVLALPAADVGVTDGIVGLFIGPGDDVHVDDLRYGRPPG